MKISFGIIRAGGKLVAFAIPLFFILKASSVFKLTKIHYLNLSILMWPRSISITLSLFEVILELIPPCEVRFNDSKGDPFEFIQVCASLNHF